MPKPTKYAALICIVLTVLAIIGIVIGIIKSLAVVTMILLLPAIVYEIYRTEGRITKWASWALLGIFALEVILIITNINIDITKYLNLSGSITSSGLPMGDLRFWGPTIMIAISGLLFYRTRGIYTKWLAAIIFITSIAVIYILDPALFGKLLGSGMQKGMDKLQNPR